MKAACTLCRQIKEMYELKFLPEAEKNIRELSAGKPLPQIYNKNCVIFDVDPYGKFCSSCCEKLSE